LIPQSNAARAPAAAIPTPSARRSIWPITGPRHIGRLNPIRPTEQNGQNAFKPRSQTNPISVLKTAGCGAENQF